MIDYRILADSVDFYEQRGFSRIESPWTVTQQISAITKPKGRMDFVLEHNEKCLVASGEQSFLYLMVKGYLAPGCYQTITPCFRYEPFDEHHGKYFVKNELIDTKNVSTDRFRQIVSNCVEFFSRYLNVRVEDNDSGGVDITHQGHELGSYGIREHKHMRWIYATGCAEPRLSRLIKSKEPNLVVNTKTWDTTREK